VTSTVETQTKTEETSSNGANGEASTTDIDGMVARLGDLKGELLSASVQKICAALVLHDVVMQESTLKAVKEKTGLTLKTLKLTLLEAKKKHFKNVCDLDTGSDAEVADFILHQFTGPIVFTEGDFLTLNDASKLWTVLERSTIELHLHNLDGSTKASGEMWRADDRNVKGAINRMIAIAARPKFFSEAPRGLALKNTFLFLDGHQIKSASLTAEHRARFALPWSYDGNARAPKFRKFLHEVFQGDPDAEQKIELILQFAGACLLGIAWTFQKCIVLIGEGANGKSTLIEILRALFEASKVVSIPPNRLTDQYYVAELVGKVINLCAETPRSELRDSDKFKLVVTGDWTTGRAPYKPVTNFQPIAGHLFGCNELPGTDDQSKGFWRRFVVVIFNREFAEHEQNKSLAAEIIAAEMPGILRMALDAAARLLAAKNYTIPKSSEEAQRAWQNSTDSVARFAEECLADPTKDTKHSSSTTVYRNFKQWTRVHGEPLMSHGKFSRRLSKLGFKKDHTETGEVFLVSVREWEGKSSPSLFD